MKTCSVPGCDGKLRGHGYCEKHYTRWRRHGDPLGGSAPHSKAGEPMKFLKEAAQSNTDDCIIWPYAGNSRYGRIWIQGKAFQCTHIVLELAGYKRPSEDHFALHKPNACHNPSCVNPRHLRWGTQSENMMDKHKDGTDQRGEKSFKTKLTWENVTCIRTDNRGYRKIAADYGVSKSTVARIKKHKVWKKPSKDRD